MTLAKEVNTAYMPTDLGAATQYAYSDGNDERSALEADVRREREVRAEGG